MKYGAATIKSNLFFFLYGIVSSLDIDSKVILQETSKTQPYKKLKLDFRIKTTRASSKVLLKSNHNFFYVPDNTHLQRYQDKTN